MIDSCCAERLCLTLVVVERRLFPGECAPVAIGARASEECDLGVHLGGPRICASMAPGENSGRALSSCGWKQVEDDDTGAVARSAWTEAARSWASCVPHRRRAREEEGGSASRCSGICSGPSRLPPTRADLAIPAERCARRGGEARGGRFIRTRAGCTLTRGLPCEWLGWRPEPCRRSARPQQRGAGGICVDREGSLRPPDEKIDFLLGRLDRLPRSSRGLLVRYELAMRSRRRWCIERTSRRRWRRSQRLPPRISAQANSNPQNASELNRRSAVQLVNWVKVRRGEMVASRVAERLVEEVVRMTTHSTNSFVPVARQ